MKLVDEHTRHRLIDAAINTLIGGNGSKIILIDDKPDPIRKAIQIMQQPIICDIVVYTLSALDKQNGLQNNGADECPAIIVRVWDNNLMNLRLLTDGPETPWRTSVPLGDGPGQWSWPKVPHLGGGDKHR